MKRAAVPVLLFLLLSGCASLSGGITASDPFRSQAEQRLVVRVENTNRDPMSVVVVAPGRRYQLGQVDGSSLRQYSVPWPRQQEVRFQIEPIAGSRTTTNSVVAGPGDQVWLQIGDPISRSVVRR